MSTPNFLSELEFFSPEKYTGLNFQDSYFADDTHLRSSNILGGSFAKASDPENSPFAFGSLHDIFITENESFMQNSFKNLGTDFYSLQTEGGGCYNYRLSELQELFEAKNQFDQIHRTYLDSKEIEFQKVVKSEIEIFGIKYRAKCKIDFVCGGFAYDLKVSSKLDKDRNQSKLSPSQNGQMWFYSQISGLPFRFLVWNRHKKTYSFQSVDFEQGRKIFHTNFIKKLSENQKSFDSCKITQ